jgi:lipoate-protein ligase A
MLLNDIGKSPDATFRRINQHLETNYGFKISEDASDKDLVSIMEQIEDEITDLKIKGNDAKISPEISKRLLVLEGMRSLREFAMMQFQSPDLDFVVDGLSDYVADCFKLSGTTQADYEEAMRDAMKHYRSSRYRFPDDMIEQRVRQQAMMKIQSSPSTGELGVKIEDPLMMEEDADMKSKDLAEEDKWGSVGKRASAQGGHSANPNTPQAKRVIRALDNPSLSLTPPDEDEQVPMIRDKNGRMVPDPFKSQAAQRSKGIVMKENLVKNLRRLLETEVSQAEVMMAAKGFAQELQEMVEKIGRLQNEDLPPVTDQMRETYGMESASAFQTQIYGALQSVMDSLYTAKGQVDDAVGNMAATGSVTAEVDMDKDIMNPGMDVDAMDDLDNIEADFDTGDDMDDEFGGADEEEPLGRAMKESALQEKITEMKRLVEKARSLKELSVDAMNNYRTAAVKDIDKKLANDKFGPAMDRAGKTATATMKIRSQGGQSKSARDIRNDARSGK